ncbi:hypothetical protein [Mycolicibacterium mageritense]|uniref:Uncharacterized protein n=1 Tax=Mycolicibacterium mageritense TaxID=53462 RepID=A0AAI8TYW5_MYCME|nr:hypothetical protein [Mycolicibacterium mageritense]BDY31399.1 hypothetical protein hbim_05351 [Mycolicibacterium mageritense]
MNQADATLFTRAFAAGALLHPGDDKTPSRSLPIPGFRAAGMSDEQAEEMIGQAAKLWGEALAHYIHTNGKTIIETAELQQLRQDAADAPDGVRVIRIHQSNLNGPVVLELTIDKSNDAAIPDTVLRALQKAAN